MSIKRDRMKWECVANHLPDWIEDNDVQLHSEMTPQELDRMEVLLDMYNSLSDKEESKDEDAFSIYGIEDEKQGIVDEIISIYEKYKPTLKQ